MAKKKMQCLWQQGREIYVPLLFNPYRRFTPPESSGMDSIETQPASGGNGDDDEWTEENEEASRRNGRGRGGRRSRSGRASFSTPASSSKESELSADLTPDGYIAALQASPILLNKGDFLITIGPELKERNHGRSEGEEGRGVNYFPSLKYPLQIVYVVDPPNLAKEKPLPEENLSNEAEAEPAQQERTLQPIVQCLSVENKLDKLIDFVHAKECLLTYVILQRDGAWKRVSKDQFGFNHAQQRRLEETLGQTSVLPRDGSDSISYAHA